MTIERHSKVKFANDNDDYLHVVGGMMFSIIGRKQSFSSIEIWHTFWPHQYYIQYFYQKSSENLPQVTNKCSL